MFQFIRPLFVLFFALLSSNVIGQYQDYNFNHIAYCVAEQSACISDTLYSSDAMLRHHQNSDEYFIIFQGQNQMVQILDLKSSEEFAGLHTNKENDKLYVIQENLPYVVIVAEIFGPTNEYGMIYQFSQEEIYLSGN
ncbi:MAG: hypothetical protein AAF487_03890 [Bacteroidota bacterium]